MPHDASAELIEHVRVCAACAAFGREIDEFEQRLHEAARLAVPEGLAEQILLRRQRLTWLRRMRESVRNWLVSRGSAPRTVRPVYALAAASIVLVVAATVIAFDVTGRRNEPAERFITHVIAEPEVLRDNAVVEPAKFDQAIGRYGGHVKEPLGIVRHLGNCVIDGVVAQHILVQTPYGTATLILIPEHLPASAKPLTLDGYTVAVIPLRDGSLGIVTDSPEKTNEVMRLLEKRVSWES
jgi:hypothetical protein